ncbi:class I SAM-dependent methyltransferase [Endozoicomonas arenosclerae]|uniref:class I SAM-dependent methyltransferase n=1 Tax=Endozoicomonas arenosclerae TaxID=1633495 RepID=UPI00078177E8|nr:class I SAM-dependent methyltransferase [Endozoicomonas arenosclerae]
MSQIRKSSDQDVIDGQAIYSKKMLSVYDIYVLGFSNHLIWRCPTKFITDLYNQNISDRHLDVGVGTGYFLDKCRFPSDSSTVVLLDLNKNSLDATAMRIKRYQPSTFVRNILEPIELPETNFQSIAINYLLHCIPGSIPEKAVVFDHLLPHLQKGGVIFGSTIIHKGIQRGFFARKLMAIYNEKGIFHNTNDSLEDLEQALSNRFSRFEIETRGVVALFKAWK